MNLKKIEGLFTNTFGEDSKHYIYATHMGLGLPHTITNKVFYSLCLISKRLGNFVIGLVFAIMVI
jgi:hypothetical protein